MKVAFLAAAATALALAAHKPAARLYHAARATVATKASAPDVKPIDPATVPPTEIGMNLASLNYWTTEESFVSPLLSHGWFGIELPDGSRGDDLTDQVPQDENGWPLHMPLGTKLTVQAGSARAFLSPQNCTISPGWKIEQMADARVSQEGTRFTLSKAPKPQFDAMLLAMTAQKPDASLTDFACGPHDPGDAPRFRADFLADIKPFRVIRFMDWMKANEEPAGTWAKRPTTKRFSPLKAGMPVETMVALANLNHSDPWFTLPFHADADYQRRFATYVRDHLAPDRKVYVELSNEVWNTSFPQAKEATRLGKERYPSVDDSQANDYYYADRVREMMGIWTQVFAGQPQRLVRVLSDLAAWSQRAENALGHEQTWRSVDALAISPYFGDVPNDVPGVGRQRVEGILASTPAAIDQTIGWAKANKQVANKYGLKLIAYEGGPGFHGYGPEMTKDVTDALHDPRFYALYMTFLERWRKEIGGLFVAFDSTSDHFWGHLDRTGQPWSEAPKMHALTDFIAKLPAGTSRP